MASSGVACSAPLVRTSSNQLEAQVNQDQNSTAKDLKTKLSLEPYSSTVGPELHAKPK